MLSIVTITKGDPVGLARTLKSTELLRQQGVEHIVVDGSSVPSQEAFPPQVRWVRREAAGIADAFNHGLSLVASEWTWFLNGGDGAHESLDPGWLLMLLKRTRADLIVGGVQYDGDTTWRPQPGIGRQWPVLECWLPHPATLVRTQTLRAAGGFSSDFQVAMDFELWQRLIESRTVVDVVAVPFARFDLRGISQSEHGRRIAAHEESGILLRHSGRLLGGALRRLGATSLRLARALYARVFRSGKSA